MTTPADALRGLDRMVETATKILRVLEAVSPQPRQLELSEALCVPSNGTPTSNAAAESITEYVSALRWTVLQYIGACGEIGATCDQAEEALKLRHQTCSARFNDLMRAGKIVEAGKRPTRSGRNAVVWVVAP